MEKSSGTNTVLLVIILLVIVGALVWLFTSRNARTRDAGSDDATIQVTIPSGNRGNGTENQGN